MTYLFFKNKPKVEIQTFEWKAINEARKDSKNKVFKIGTREYKYADIAFFGFVCLNPQCHRIERGHPHKEICEYTFTGACVTCGKKIWERDKAYSLLKFGKVVCREHSPYGIAARNPKTPEDCRDALVEGLIVGYQRTGQTITQEKAIELANQFMRRVDQRQ